VLGNIGNTGNSSAPHLHFHVMSTPDPLRSDGLPFVFRAFRLTDRLADMAAVDAVEAGGPARPVPGFTVRAETNVSPLNLDVMTYDN
jgi:murein DD-endopeptidase MepM/ murein hydrolase activator NlpD